MDQQLMFAWFSTQPEVGRIRIVRNNRTLLEMNRVNRYMLRRERRMIWINSLESVNAPSVVIGRIHNCMSIATMDGFRTGLGRSTKPNILVHPDHPPHPTTPCIHVTSTKATCISIHPNPLLFPCCTCATSGFGCSNSKVCWTLDVVSDGETSSGCWTRVRLRYSWRFRCCCGSGWIRSGHRVY
jgi:hypothetical protein